MPHEPKIKGRDGIHSSESEVVRCWKPCCQVDCQPLRHKEKLQITDFEKTLSIKGLCPKPFAGKVCFLKHSALQRAPHLESNSILNAIATLSAALEVFVTEHCTSCSSVSCESERLATYQLCWLRFASMYEILRKPCRFHVAARLWMLSRNQNAVK